jgi:glutaredoxin
MTDKTPRSIATLPAPACDGLRAPAVRRLALVLLLCATASAHSANLYRWVDKDGKVHYSDEAPPAAQKVERKTLNSGRPEGAATPADSRPAVVLYTAADCDDNGCKSARTLLSRLRIPYVEKALKTADDAAEYQKAMGSEAISVPTLLVGQKWQKGFEEKSWKLLLDSAGYAEAK